MKNRPCKVLRLDRGGKQSISPTCVGEPLNRERPGEYPQNAKIYPECPEAFFSGQLDMDSTQKHSIPRY